LTGRLPDPTIGISGTGSYLPGTVVTNQAIASVLRMEADAIYRVTGIRERRLRDERENIYVMGAIAGMRAIADAGLTMADIAAIYCCVDPCGEVAIPGAANLIQHLLGLPALRAPDGAPAPNLCPACDIPAGCSAPLFGLEAAMGKILSERLLRSRPDAKVLVIAGDSASNVVDWRDRETAMIFSDGFGAVVVEDLELARLRRDVVTPDLPRPGGVLSLHLASDGSKADTICQLTAHTARLPDPMAPAAADVPREFVRMKGAEVYRNAVRRMQSSLQAALERAGLGPADIDLFIPHQANLQILRRVFGDRISPDPGQEQGDFRVYTRGVTWEGNCSAGTLFVALDRLSRAGRLQPGMLVAMPTFGAGMGWGTAVLRWHKPARPRLNWADLEVEQRRGSDALVARLHAGYLELIEKMRAAASPQAGGLP
jgi:3-oxoacyl-[acyl-carrier-protein] synthase-3